MKVLVTGSRDWVDQGPVERELKKLPPGSIVVHGGARGVDNIAGFVARNLGFTVREYRADWERHGKYAGPLRNQEMLKREHPDQDGAFFERALAFHKDPDLGRGTKNMVGQVREADPPIEVQIFQR